MNTSADTPVISIVIAARNAGATIAAQLDAICAQETALAWEVVVVDDESTDGTRSIVDDYAAKWPNIRMVSGRGLGVSAARNAGIKASSAPAVVTVDADDVVAQGWLSAMAAALSESPLVAGALEIRYLNPERVLETRGSRLTLGPGSYSGIFQFAHSCNLGVQRRVLDTVGGFDESLTAGEDIEFSYRCWRGGINLAYAESAIVHYRYRTTLRGLWRQGMAYGRIRPLLRRRFSADGVSVPPSDSARACIGIIKRMPSLLTGKGRANWVFNTAGVIGEIASRERS
ncbi:Glycosyl transferase family 2 [Actinobacteria bacterium IMCC26256]|nr:Glycosyl transferase family 2 [Actinobacteria bacterium IMCC26256]